MIQGPAERLGTGLAGSELPGVRAGMTQEGMRQAAGLGPRWQLIWEGRHALPSVQHICAGLYGRDGTDASK